MKSCEFCGTELPNRRSTAKYCDDRCKQGAYLERHGKPPQNQPPQVCLNPRCDNEIDSYAYYKTKYCSSACRKAVYNAKPETRKKRHKYYMESPEKKERDLQKAIDRLVDDIVIEKK